MEEKITGYIDHIIFRNEENGYTVLVMTAEDEEITCVGNLQAISQGETVEALGRYVEHPTYGKQFLISSFETKVPEDAVAMERYLGSGAIKGVGTALAARIVRRFKGDTLRIVEEEPERLAEVKGISKRMAMQIGEQVAEKSDMRNAMMFLQKYGISLTLGAKIYKHYKQEMYTIIKENPYRMAEDIQGVGFKIADEIAAKTGIEKNSEFRIRSGLLYMLSQATLSGHIYVPQQLLLEKTAQILEIDTEGMEQQLMNLAIERKIVIRELQDQVIVYNSHLYHLELDTARMLNELNVSGSVDLKTLERRVREIEEELGTTLDELQHQAVIEAAQNGLFILTGGPGTGKTTTINTMIRYFEAEGLSIALAAPTGRAAKRMTEATGCEARTVHRLLELSGGVEENDRAVMFERNEQNPLDVDVVIIDEMSMVDIYLVHALLAALSVGTRLILVGDVNQLPSVGPGNVLRDIINSHAFHVVELNKIFRQATQSDIVVNAHKINHGKPVALDNKSMDFFFLKRYDANIIIRVLIALIQEKLPKFVDARPSDIQVLTPMRKGILGVEQLNQILQRYLNPSEPGKKEKEFGTRLFRQGDKVMQIKNNYQLEWEIRGLHGIAIDNGIGVFNGDTGIIRELNDYAEIMTVEFEDGRFVDYSYKQLDELELAYAITIHKSQGSEYPAVVIPLLGGPRMLLNRNLLYTAVTRARKCVTIVGSEVTFQAMIDNEREQKRYSTLECRIREFGEKGDG